jgi:hypothetical protein
VSLRGGWLPALLIASGIVVFSWPYSLAAPIGIDESWRVALHLTGPSGLHFGEDIVFTYGPLGFLSVPTPFVGVSSVLAIVATAGVYLAAAATLLVLASRLLPGWAAIVVVLVTARAVFPFLPPFEMLQALVFVWCVEAVLAEAAPTRFRVPAEWLIAGAGFVAAIALIGKVNVGVFAAGMLLVASVFIGKPWWRGAAIFAGVSAAGCLVIWFVTGQPLGALPAFAAESIEVVRGYSDAMVVDTHPTLRWVYAAFAIAVAILVWLGWQVTGGRPRPERLALLALGLIIAFAEWKTAFTRNYTFYAMATALVALFALASRLPRGLEGPGGASGRAIAAFGFATIFVALLATARIEPIDLVDVRGSLRSTAATAVAVLPWRQAEAVEGTRAELRAGLDVPDDVLAAVAGQTVHIDQWQSVAALAYPEMRWWPLPLFQSYSAYTTALDEINAERLRSAAAPTRILRERVDDVDGTPYAVDRRFVWFESPAAMLETFCRYDELAANDRWQVLGRTERSCGIPELISTASARAGESVPVPPETRPGRFVIVRITGFPDGILDKLRTLAFRADEWYVELPDRGRFRLIPGTADDGLLLAVPTGLSAHPRFAFGPPITALTVSAGRYGDASDAVLTFEFLSVPLPGGAG